MLRNPWASPLNLLTLTGADITDVTTIVQQVYRNAKVERVADHLAIETNTRGARDLIVRRLRTTGYVTRSSDLYFCTVLGRDADHPVVRSLSAEDLDERIAHLTALREQATTTHQQ
ncbi:hypothetical protein [Nocardiopsis sp. NPDC006938]|uniref:hypothetical protein n=1 Tax=Nocardiopsis sp. NPDC006938 TaxID=3364337 RepID=UPI00369D20E4